MSKHILIVEDDTTLSAVYAMVLNANGYDTTVACNGLEALKQIKTRQPDVILLDLLMPQMDGITFLKTYEPDPQSAPRIIVFSNLFDSRKEHEVKSLGAIDIVLKASITPDDLVQIVESQLIEN